MNNVLEPIVMGIGLAFLIASVLGMLTDSYLFLRKWKNNELTKDDWIKASIPWIMALVITLVLFGSGAIALK